MTAQILNDDRIVSWSLAELEAKYWFDVDHNWGRRAREFYIEDAIFDLGIAEDTRYLGIAEIEQFYRWRESRGERTARHLITNYVAEITGGHSASAHYIMSLYAEDGHPVRPSKPAIMIADASIKMSLCADGVWRASERILKPIFMGGIKPTAMRIKDGR